jgi:hypothetical protein
VNAVVLDHMLALARDESASTQVRAIVSVKLEELKKWTAARAVSVKDEETRAQLFFAASQIERYQKSPTDVHPTAPVAPPDGDPIGTDDWE